MLEHSEGCFSSLYSLDSFYLLICKKSSKKYAVGEIFTLISSLAFSKKTFSHLPAFSSIFLHDPHRARHSQMVICKLDRPLEETPARLQDASNPIA